MTEVIGGQESETPMPPDLQLSLVRLNEADADAVRPALLACCASTGWVDGLLARRPFASRDEAVAASDAVMAEVDAGDIDAALSGHPRIGDRAEGQGADARWSRQEQATVANAGADIQTQLRDGNVAYEQRFDRVFLIRAAGRSPHDMLAELHRRLDLDDESEQAEVREQLRQITRLRLERLLADD